MKVSDFNYELPKELIAQHPLEKRDESRLMVLNREKKEIEHKHFKEIIDYLNPGPTGQSFLPKHLCSRPSGQKQ